MIFCTVFFFLLFILSVRKVYKKNKTSLPSLPLCLYMIDFKNITFGCSYGYIKWKKRRSVFKNKQKVRQAIKTINHPTPTKLKNSSYTEKRLPLGCLPFCQDRNKCSKSFRRIWLITTWWRKLSFFKVECHVEDEYSVTYEASWN